MSSNAEEKKMEEYCFMIQPFDGGKFDKRYEDVFKPAIEAAGLIAYRVDNDDLATVPIDAIEEKIKASTICVADITLDNPNVWYEVGFALASNKITILICSDERTGDFPFDIRQRKVLQYKTESKSDFDELRNKLSNRIGKLKNSVSIAQVYSISEKFDDLEGLSYQEVIFLAAVLMVQDTPDEYVSIWNIKEQMKRSGFNEIAYSICARKLLNKKFIEISLLNDYQGNEYNGISITDKGNEWILKNENKFSFGCNNASNSFVQIDDTLPFN